MSVNHAYQRGRGIVAMAAFGVFAFGTALPVAAEEGRSAVEEIIVTAQRTEESIQDVPIAVTAFTGETLEAKQIITPSDLQLNTPSTTFSATNFGGSTMTIRGIGSLLIGTGSLGVSTHLDEIPLPTNLVATEFYDMERVEVLRGPQGTLYGRNATSGVINLVTAKPNLDAVNGNIDVEYGDYNHLRVKGALNLPVTETVGLRFAGMQLERDGYIENTAYGQVGAAGTRGEGTVLQNIDDDIDGRDITSYRITGLWEINDNMNAWVQYNKFRENDDRARITNQVCQMTPVPVYGCDPDAFGFDTPNLGTTTGGVTAGQVGAIPFGTPVGTRAFPQTSKGLRKMHTDFEPEYYFNQDAYTAEFNYELDDYTFTISGGYQETQYWSQMDYLMDVGPDLSPTNFATPLGPANPTGYWPTSSPAGRFTAGFDTPQCDFNAGTVGQFGGCLYPADTTRVFAYDQSDATSEYWTVEGKIQSNFDGPINFLLGGGVSNTTGDGGSYFVLANTLDMYKTIYPSLYANVGNPDKSSEVDSKSVFGELYWQATDNIKFTVGLRYNDDTLESSSANPFFTALDGCAYPAISFLAPFLEDCATGIQKAWFRTAALGLISGYARGTPGAAGATALAEYWGVYDAYDAACGPNTGWDGALFIGCAGPAEYAAAMNILQQGIPPVPGFNETRNITGSPSKVDFQKTTGRAGVDWQVSDSSMVFAFYTRGYKPGGLNPAVSPEFQGSTPFTFDAEEVDSYEIGSKNLFLNNSLMLNGSVFYYDYKGLQVGRIVNNTAVNDNINAKNWGVELETVWRPEAMPNLSIDATYSYLKAEVDGATSIDPLDRGAGDPNLIALKNIDAGALSGQTYVANRAQITQDVIDGAFAVCAAYSAANPAPPPGCPAVLPGTDYPDGLPAFFSKNFLDTAGVFTSSGLEKSIDGNTLPGSPENTFNIGIAYDIEMGFGRVTPRIDYHWQDDQWGREFNSPGDAIEAWDQWNASVSFMSNDSRWQGMLWVRNLEDEDNVTGHYLTSDTSGFFRNYFLTEPRIWGASVRYNFGEM